MNTKKFLVEYEVESHGALVDDLPSVNYRHPIDGTEIEVRNFRVAPGTDVPLLLMRCVIAAEDLDSAIEHGTAKLIDFVHHLAFVANMRFRLHRLSKVVDWTPGLSQRDCYLYSPLYGRSELPFMLDSEQFQAIEFLQRADTSPAFRRALRWYGNGLAAEEMEDQFQYFWLSIEVLSTLNKPQDEVPDKCAKCGGNLFCNACQGVTTHKRYPGQLIKALFARYVRGDHELFFKDAQKIRHALAHGEDLHEVENKHGIGARNMADQVGRLAWTALLDGFQRAPKQPNENSGTTFRLTLLQPTTFMHEFDQIALHLTVTSKDLEHPSLNDIPDVEMSRNFVKHDAIAERKSKDIAEL